MTAPTSKSITPRVSMSMYAARPGRASASSQKRRDRSIGPEVNVAKKVRKYR